MDGFIDVTPSVLKWTQIASSLAYRQDNILARLYIAISWTEIGVDSKSPTRRNKSLENAITENIFERMFERIQFPPLQKVLQSENPKQEARQTVSF